MTALIIRYNHSLLRTKISRISSHCKDASNACHTFSTFKSFSNLSMQRLLIAVEIPIIFSHDKEGRRE
ncbi:Hypothetical predicted protein [Cloeon dipterum]|uniref:Uncharacterized protein n=1 Tax=Cloeon dipterum TaxID=197152 RepID=A0A8S1C767_9INSE|nr:Hypothetical predicted protein [Cloeon dipterum]